jgi:hypothetical protein
MPHRENEPFSVLSYAFRLCFAPCILEMVDLCIC